MKNEITYKDLVSNVEKAHNMTSTYAKGAVNQLLTVRNWIIGYYIVEFEQNRKDRAEYGAKLLAKLSTNLNIKGLDRTALNLCRIFYQKYPQICETVSHKLRSIGYLEGIPEKDDLEIDNTELEGAVKK